jgi:hypothetical protein
MSFTEILVAISICAAIFGVYCATRRVAFSNNDRARIAGSSGSPRFHFVTRREFADLAKSTHDQVHFHLRSAHFVEKHAKSSFWSAGISVEELERCIAWIPYDSSIFVSSADGFSPALLRSLKRLRTRRELFLIRELPDNLSSIEQAEARVL